MEKLKRTCKIYFSYIKLEDAGGDSIKLLRVGDGKRRVNIYWERGGNGNIGLARTGRVREKYSWFGVGAVIGALVYIIRMYSLVHGSSSGDDGRLAHACFKVYTCLYK